VATTTPPPAPTRRLVEIIREGLAALIEFVYAGRMLSKLRSWLSNLPFVGRIFWKVLVAVAVLVVIAWVVVVSVSYYEIKPADYGGSTIAGIIFAYLVHLWLLPEEESPSSDE
jgi:hypothetical protein